MIRRGIPKLPILLSLPFLTLVVGAIAQDAPPTQLTCISLRAAEEHLQLPLSENDPLTYLCGITYPFAGVISDEGDLILVGERRAELPLMSLDDLVVALRICDSLDTPHAPGVSIDPESHSRYVQRQFVRFVGGIEQTNFGKVCFEADLLLKLMGYGYADTGLSAVPNEWDLTLHRIKDGYRLDPFAPSWNRIWFFPSHASVSTADDCVVLHSCQLAVNSESIGIRRWWAEPKGK